MVRAGREVPLSFFSRCQVHRQRDDHGKHGFCADHHVTRIHRFSQNGAPTKPARGGWPVRKLSATKRRNLSGE